MLVEKRKGNALTTLDGLVSGVKSLFGNERAYIRGGFNVGFYGIKYRTRNDIACKLPCDTKN